MTIAVPYESGLIFQDFGRATSFKIYDTQNSEVFASTVVDIFGYGDGVLAGFLQDQGVDALLCGSISGKTKKALISAGIAVYGGASGDADKAVDFLLAGNLPDHK